MTEPPPPLKKNRLPHRLLMGIVSVFLAGAGMLLCASYFFFHDDPPPEDQDLLPRWTTEGRTTNPLANLQDWITKHPLPSEDPVLKKLLNEETWDTNTASKMLETESERLHLFDQFVASSTDTWFWKDDDEMAHMAHLVPYLTQMQKLADLVRVRAKWHIDQGRSKDALKDCESLMKLGRGLQRAEGGLIHYLIGITIHAQSCMLIDSVLRTSQFDVSELAALTTRLKALSPSTSDMEFAFRVDYLSIKRLLDELEQDPSILASLGDGEDNRAAESAIRLEFRKNRTLKEKAVWARELIHHFSSPWSDLHPILERTEQELSDFKASKAWLALGRNWTGSIIHMLTRPSEVKVIEKGCTLQVLHQLVLGEIALRLHELNTGTLPAEAGSLDLLPSDYFSAKPLHWSPDKRVIYSVGLDGQNDGGQIDLKRPPKGKDIGLPYWWSTSGHK